MQAKAAQTLGVGLAGGVVGLLAMRVAMRTTQRFVAEPDPLAPRDGRSMSLVGELHEEGERATDAVARNVYSAVSGRPPTTRQKAVLGQSVHLAFGMLMGAVYAWLRGPRLRRPDVVGGALFGAALWAVGDELVVPMLGLADKPTRYPVSVHAQALAGHLAYGAATGAVVGALRGAALPPT